MAGISHKVHVDEIKQWLKGYQDALEEEKRLQEEIARWKSKAEKMTTSFSQAPGGGKGTPSSFTTAVEMMMKMQEELAITVAKSSQRRFEIEKVIHSLEDEEQRTVMNHIYILGMTQYDLAERLNRSRETISRVHAKALSSIANASRKVTFIFDIPVF